MPSPRRPRYLAVFLAVSAGCSSKIATLPPPSYDAEVITQAALAQLDKNKNGQIDGAELDACPALKRSLAAIDKNGDKSISAAELKQRVELYARQGFVPLTCTVTLDGRPLAEARVTFEPEPFMASCLKPATAVTDGSGVCGEFQVDGKPWTAIAAGLYRIKVTKDGTTIPAKFNAETTLGREVVADARQGEATIELALTSR